MKYVFFYKVLFSKEKFNETLNGVLVFLGPQLPVPGLRPSLLCPQPPKLEFGKNIATSSLKLACFHNASS